MNLIILAAFIAVCGAAKLDRTYLPPASAKTAGGSPGALQAPNSFSTNEAPKGSYNNDFQGVVVDAALAGTRTSGSEVSGLGGPRNSYGSTASKVGEAAFRGSQAGFRFPVSTQEETESNSQFQDSNLRSERPQANQFGNSRDTPERAQSFEARDSISEISETFGVAKDSRPERPQAAQERTASTLRFDSEVGEESFNYAFETDNGISAEESGTATNGVQAQGGYSYTGDDGKVYTVTYTADEGGYQPRGDHLPTPPPIPEEILKSLEQNARDEANGVVDDGLYDAQKYNEGGDYAESDIVNAKQNGRPSVNTGNSDVDTSGSFISQNNLPLNPNNQRQRNEVRAPVNRFQTASSANGNGNFQSNSATGNRFGSRNEYLPPFNNQNRPQNSRPQVSTANVNTPDADSSSTFQQEMTEGSGDFHSDSHDNQQAAIRPVAPAFSRPSNQNQFNGFKQSSMSNQFNQNANRFPSSQDSRPQFGSHGGHSQFSAQPSSPSLNSQHATSIPDTELTTPFEFTSNQDGSQPSAPTATNAFGFDAQSRPGQPQFGFQNTQREPTTAPAQPTIPSFTQSRPQNSNNRPLNGNRHSQSVFSSQAPQEQEQFNQQSQFGNKRPQFSQNQFSLNSGSSLAPSTQKPQFDQQSNTQDDSYYYNQPSRGFNTPKTQGSRFPSAPSHQFDRVTQRPSFSSQTTQYSEEENYPSTPFPTQNGQRQGTTRYPRPSAVSTESTPSDNHFQGNTITSATNGITQASASSFAAPTSATGFNRQQFVQSRQQYQQSPFQSNRPSPQPIKPFVAQTTAQPQSNQGQQFEHSDSKPAQPLSQQPLQDIKQPKLDDDESPADTPVTNPQYDGELYEYNKPAELPPAPKDGFGQFGTKVHSSKPTQSRPQISQSTITEAQQPTSGPSSASKPSRFGQPAKSSQEQFESRPPFTQTSVPQPEKPTFGSFGSKPMRFGQTAKVPQADQFGAQTTQEQSSNDKFNMKPSRQQFSQSAQGTEEVNNQFQAAQTSQRRPFSTQAQGNFGSSAVENSRPNGQNDRQSCCNAGKISQSQNFEQGRPSQFGGESQFEQNSFQGSSGLRPDQSQSVAGRGEVFGGPRKPPSFDENGYHY